MVNNMEHIFKSNLGPAYGLDGDDDMAADKRVDLAHAGRAVSCLQHFWTSPDGHELLISLRFRCPRCSFPLHVGATQAGVSRSDAGTSMRTPVSCPAHWEAVNAAGHTLGRREQCASRWVIRDDELHDVSCPVSNFTLMREYSICNCQSADSDGEN